MNAVTFSTYGFPEASYSYSVQFAREQHFDGVEVLFRNGGFDEGGLLPSSNDVRTLLRELAGLRRTVHAPFAEVALLADDGDERRAGEHVVLACLEAAAAIEAELVVVHLERQPMARRLHADEGWQYLDIAADLVARLADRATLLGLTLGLENLHSNRAVDIDPRWLVDLVDRVDRPAVGITFDLGHAQLGFAGPHPVRDAARLFGHRVRHYHVHDNDGTADQHTQLGLGDVDIDVLPVSESDGPVLALEIFPHTPIDVPQALTASLRVLRDRGAAAAH